MLRGETSDFSRTSREAILAHGCEHTIKELITVKSDDTVGKKELLYQLIKNGEFHMKEGKFKSRTKDVVDVLLKFLKE